MKKNEQELDTFFLAFMGQRITITVNLTVSTPQTSTDFEEVPVYYEGILLDKDDEYYYLGSTPNEITQAVKKSSVIHIMLFEETDPYKEFLDQLPTPDKKEEIN